MTPQPGDRCLRKCGLHALTRVRGVKSFFLGGIKVIRKVAIALLLLLVFIGGAYGYVLNPTVVTASRLAEKWLNSPASVEVVTGDELRSMGAVTLADALRFVVGLEYGANGPVGMDNWLTIRGVTKEIVVMIDGVPVNNPQGESANFSFNLGLIPISEVKRIEIVKGAASSLYGDAAFGGVVNIITKGGTKQKRASLSAQTGDNDYRHYSFSASGNEGGLGYFISGVKFSMGKVRGYHKYIPFGENTYYYDDFLGSDGKFIDFKIGGKMWTFYYGYANVSCDYQYLGYANTSTTKTNFYHFLFDYGLWSANLYYHKYNKEYITTNPFSAPYNSHEDVVKGLDIRRKFILSDNNLLIVGVNLERQSIDSTTDDSHSRDLKSVYFEDRLLSSGVEWTIGGRYETIDQSDAKDYTEFLPRFGVSVGIGKGRRWFLNVGRAFKLPTFDDLYFNNPWTPGNPNLEPERGWTYETGVKGVSDRIEYKLSFFYQTLSDYISWAPKKDNPFIWTPSNVQDFRMGGVEFSLRYKVSDHFGYFVGLTYERAEDKGNPNAQDSSKWYKCGIPEWQAKVGIFYRDSKNSFSLHYEYVGKREFNDLYVPYTLSSYGVVNLSLHRKFSSGLELGIDVSNLFDASYEVRKGYLGEGRRVYLMLSYEF